MSGRRVAIVGFGFSGLLVTANLVRRAVAGTIIYLISEDLRGLGVAYATTNPQHLLNVTAERMGAFPDAIDDLLRWLQTPEAAAQKARLGLTQDYGAGDFIPRQLYGKYLDAIWRDTQALAAEKLLQLKLVETTAVSITPGTPLAVLTARGDAIAVDEVVLATGHETKPVLTHLPRERVIQNPWAPGALAEARHWEAPVMLMGTGLTAVDMVLSLRAQGYLGPIVAFSRHGLLPQPHVRNEPAFTFAREELLQQPSLVQLLKLVRRAIRTHGYWRPVIEALRPHTQALWLKLSTPEQVKFQKRLAAFWSVHRHRMAPEIGEKMVAEIARGGLRVVGAASLETVAEEAVVTITLTTHDGVVERFTPSRIINCTGPEMSLARSAQPLIKQALADGLIEPHATGIGLVTDPACRAWGRAHPHVYAMGSLMTGQWLESTAVPELRGQAAMVASSVAQA